MRQERKLRTARPAYMRVAKLAYWGLNLDAGNSAVPAAVVVAYRRFMSAANRMRRRSRMIWYTVPACLDTLTPVSQRIIIVICRTIRSTSGSTTPLTSSTNTGLTDRVAEI